MRLTPSHLFSQLTKSFLSDVDVLTRLLYDTLYRELVKCNKLQVLAEFVKVALQKTFPDPYWLHWYSLHTTFKNLFSLHLWQAHRKKNCEHFQSVPAFFLLERTHAKLRKTKKLISKFYQVIFIFHYSSN